MRKSLGFSILFKFFVLGAVFILMACSSNKSPQWEPLFNGKDLDNWHVKIRGYELNDNYANTFRVEDGLMKVRYDQYEDGFQDKFGHIFYKEPFSSYLLAVEYRFVGEQAQNGPGAWAYRNSGAMLHGQDPATMELDQDFPNSLEVQFLGGDGSGERSTANLCTPGTQFVKDGELITRHCTTSSSKTFHNDEWVRVEVLVLSDSLMVHYANGEEVLRYEKPQTDAGELIRSGSISLQSESHPIDFRTVEIVNLEEYEDNPQELGRIIDELMAETKVAVQE